MDIGSLPRIFPAAANPRIEAQIEKALPGEKNRELRIALLRIAHACQSAEIDLGFVGEGVAELLKDLSCGEETRAFAGWLKLACDSAVNGLGIARIEILKSRPIIKKLTSGLD